MNGSEFFVHDFDGRMYGLMPKFQEYVQHLKKPWRIVSWGVEFEGLKSKCDGKHAHGQCAGRETRRTQQYTERTINIVVNRVNRVAMKGFDRGNK